MKSKLTPLFRIVPLAIMLTAAGNLAADPAAGNPQAAYEETAAILKDPNADDAAKISAFSKMKELAAEGHVPAMAGLGYLYQEGIGTAKSPVSAAEWLQKAAEKGHAISMFNLAGLLVRDRIPLAEGEKDRGRQYAEGVDWFRKAAEAGLERARVGYGIILMRGDYGSKPDPKQAATYLIPTAEAGNLEAMNALGTMYEIGNGVPYSVATAETWFRKAAEKGHLKARSNLSRILDAHSPTHPRRIESTAWLILAEQDGDVVAKKIFNTKTATLSSKDMAEARKEAQRLRELINAARKSAAPAVE
jgi:TPR repeat protein